jgi:2-keto-4-pentenoate hydratase/2-oxohepta-3-ene-1,7-dioic acid hydratase in catechol pathway
MRIARFSYEDDIKFGVVGVLGDDEVVAPIVGDPLYVPVQPAGDPISLADVRLLAPVIPRSKVVGIGRNYAEHAAEMGNEIPATPMLFLKPNTSVIGPGEPIVYPPFSENVHYEAELAVVIGRVCKDVPAERVPEVIFGYTCGNDVTARDVQQTDGQWARAKGFDSSCPLGPWIETELDPADLAISCTINGDVRQEGRTSQMIRDVTELVTYVSSAFTLLPGDVIMTGTPSGVGPLAPGDQVAVTIEGIGSLSNRVVSHD